MADPSSRNNSLRIPRLRAPGNASRNGSVRRSSALIDDHRQLSGAFHSLRSVESRYSLNEQFAATRQEYEFGDDDASSVFSRVTEASDLADGNGDKTLAFDDIPEEGELVFIENDGVSDPCQSDHYEILCLPRGADLTQDQIRQAYYRLFLLLYPEGYPDHLQPFARQYFQHVQQAFETLVDPERRAAYDAALSSGEPEPGVGKRYEDTYLDALRYSSSSSTPPELSVGFKSVGAAVTDIEHSTSIANTRPALGFTVGHTVHVGLPALERFMQRNVPNLFGAATGTATDVSKPNERLMLGKPTLSITTSLHGLSTDIFPRPLVLLPGRFSTDCTEQAWKSPDSSSFTGSQQPAAGTAGILTAQLTQPVLLPRASGPTILDVTVESPPLGASYLPRVSAGVHHELSSGTVFVRGDSGQWLSSIAGGQLSNLITSGRKLLQWAPVATATPSVEVGFTTDTVSISEAASETTNTYDSNLPGLLKRGSWAVSATASVASMAGYLRYNQDFVLNNQPCPGWKRPSRLEAELCSSTFYGSYFALRNLLPVGRFSTAGIEVGVSRHSLHLSIHWSRLNQRVSLPVVFCPSVFSTPSLIFWAGVLPLAGLSVIELLRQQWRRWHRVSKPEPTPPHLMQASIALRRLQADNILVLLSGPVEAFQKRHASLGNLVILSAKYGVRDDNGSWASEEVADVTVALAALVDRDGRLIIPQGIRKGNLLGFWDPAPDLEKVLLVRYSWKGKEDVVEVKGSDELQLPPVKGPGSG